MGLDLNSSKLCSVVSYKPIRPTFSNQIPQSIFLYCCRQYIRLRLPFRAQQKANQMTNSDRPNQFERKLAEASLERPFFRIGHSIIQRASDSRVFLLENQYGTTAGFHRRSLCRDPDISYRARIYGFFFIEGNWDRIGTFIVRTQFVKHSLYVAKREEPIYIAKPIELRRK